MPSINDWATKAASDIVSHIDMQGEDLLSFAYDGDGHMDCMGVHNETKLKADIAAIIAAHAEPLLDVLQEARREHRKEEDPMDDCPMLRTEDMNIKLCIQHVCDCGADAFNAKLDKVLND